MQKILIEGGNKISGKVNISPAKNACLPIIASLIAMRAQVLLLNAPSIEDVKVMAQLIEQLGGKYEYEVCLLIRITWGYASQIPLYAERRERLFLSLAR